MMEAGDFYDAMAGQYHLIATDWDEAVRRQGMVLDAILERKLGRPGPYSILDCSCGIGTQAIGLALRGHRVLGTDVSPGAVARAKKEAERLGASARFETADMRDLAGTGDGFDAVISCDNSIAHLLHEEDLHAAFTAIHARLKPGGHLMLSVRDYDQLTKERPTGMLPRLIRDAAGERVYFQVWDWAPDGKSYELGLFLLKNLGERWESKPVRTVMRAHLRVDVLAALTRAGFVGAEVLEPTESGYYQPIYLAQGSATKNVEPRPTSLSTQTRP